jgi:hypothetical protein
MKPGEGGMTRSLSGGILAGTDEPLMVGLAFPTSYLEQWNAPAHVTHSVDCTWSGNLPALPAVLFECVCSI